MQSGYTPVHLAVVTKSSYMLKVLLDELRTADEDTKDMCLTEPDKASQNSLFARWLQVVPLHVTH